MDNNRQYDELKVFPDELTQRLKSESEFSGRNNLNSPSRYGRNAPSEEKIRHLEQQKNSSHNREHATFPESGVNSDTRGLHGLPAKLK